MQKRNPAVLMGVGRVTKTGRKDGAFRFPVPSYADYQPSQGLPGNPSGTGTHEPGNQPDWRKHQPDYP